jgi:hypothetical protein
MIAKMKKPTATAVAVKYNHSEYVSCDMIAANIIPPTMRLTRVNIKSPTFS